MVAFTSRKISLQFRPIVVALAALHDPLLLAPFGRESSDEAALRKHPVQDRGTTVTSGVGEPPTGSDFSDEGGRGRKSVTGVRSEKREFRPWHSREG